MKKLTSAISPEKVEPVGHNGTTPLCISCKFNTAKVGFSQCHHCLQNMMDEYYKKVILS